MLWQVLVGPPSSGKSPAMAPMRELLDDARCRAGTTSDARARSSSEASLSVVADAVTANPRGVVLWRDDPPTWLRSDAVRAPWLPAWSARAVSFGQGATGKGARRIDRFAVSLLLACQPHHLSDLLAEDPEFASRLLFAWPDPPSHCPLTLCKPARDDEALAALRRIASRRRARPTIRWCSASTSAALGAFDGFLSALRAELLGAEDLERAWLGKGRGTVARLAGVLELLASSAPGSSVPPGPIGRAPVERAVRLWSDYFRPQALALFHHSVPGERERLARRVARWLRRRGLDEVSREQVRTEALDRRVDAAETDQVLYRLQGAGHPAARPLHRAVARPAPQPLVGQSAAYHHALCRKCRKCREVVKMTAALSALDAPFQRSVELGERARRVVEHGAEGRHQQPAERLLVAQPAAAAPVAR